MEFFRHRQQRLREKGKLLDVDAQLAGARAEKIAFAADDVAQVEAFVELVVVFGDVIFLDVNLELGAPLFEVGETGFAHAANGLQTAADLHFDARGFQALRRVFVGPRRDFGQLMRGVKTMTVRGEAQLFDLPHALQALREQILFQGQMRLQSGPLSGG